jgi:hypothetical protein
MITSYIVLTFLSTYTVYILYSMYRGLYDVQSKRIDSKRIDIGLNDWVIFMIKQYTDFSQLNYEH